MVLIRKPLDCVMCTGVKMIKGLHLFNCDDTQTATFQQAQGQDMYSRGLPHLCTPTVGTVGWFDSNIAMKLYSALYNIN